VSSAIDVQPNTLPSPIPPARKEFRLLPKKKRGELARRTRRERSRR
jgi:hypothetical protein